MSGTETGTDDKLFDCVEGCGGSVPTSSSHIYRGDKSGNHAVLLHCFQCGRSHNEDGTGFFVGGVKMFLRGTIVVPIV